MDSIAIVVPSKARPDTKIHQLLPDAWLFVDEREKAAYAHHDRVVWHKPTSTIGEVRQAVLDHFQEECVFQCDDDLKCVKPLIGDKRKAITDPGDIKQIIVNGYQICHDLGLSLFCWTRNPNPMYHSPYDPFHFTCPSAAAFGVLGRRIKYDTALIHGEDIDFTLSVLLKDRIVFSDNRFYWDFGNVFTGMGGAQTIRTNERILSDIARVEKRWKGHVCLSGKPGSQKHMKWSGRTSFSIKVERKQNS